MSSESRERTVILLTLRKMNRISRDNKISQYRKRIKMDLAGLRFAMHNLGCKVNSYETEAMTEAILQEGARLVDFT